MFAACNTSSLTDESTLPTSTLDSDSDNSSESVSSSEKLDRNLEFLNYSLPLVDKSGKSNGHLVKSDNSSESVSSSEKLDRNLEFLNYSLPLVDKSGKSNGHLVKRSECNVNGDKLEDIAHTYWKNNSFSGSHLDSFRHISRSSSTQSSPRTREKLSWTELLGCSDASALYGISGMHYNPSGSGQRANQEISDYLTWTNGYLQYCPHKTHITNLTRELADGLTLLYLVEVLLGVSLTPIHVKPALEVQKIENIQACLDVLITHDIQVDNISPKDIVEENTKAILVLCKCLRKYFGSSPGSPRGVSQYTTCRTTSPRANTRTYKSSIIGPRKSHRPKTETDSSRNPFSRRSTPFPVMDIEDVALLDWVGHMTGQDVYDYECLQDGHILCLLINKLTDDAVPNVVLDYGLPSEKVSLALTFSEEELGVISDFSPDDVVTMRNVGKISSYLKALHQVFIEQVQNEQRERELQRMNELAKRSMELAKENEKKNERGFQLIEINQRYSKDHVSSKQLSLDSHINQLNKRIADDNVEKGSSLLRLMEEQESNEFKTSKERNWPRENDFPSYFEDNSYNQIARSTDDIYNSYKEEERLDGANENLHPSCSRANQNYHTPRENLLSKRFEDTNYFPQEVGNSFSKSPTPLNYSLYSDEVSLNKVSNQLSSHKKLDEVAAYFDEDLMYGLLPPESIFGSKEMEHLHKAPGTSKSWQKEREDAEIQLSDFTKQLQLLKQEYFRLMNIQIQQLPEENLTSKTGYDLSTEIIVPIDEERDIPSIDLTSPKNPSKRSVTPEKLAMNSKSKKNSGKPSSLCYINVTKGTLPPYRTWSKYENTDGDRYQCYLNKKALNADRCKLQKKARATRDFGQDSTKMGINSQEKNELIKAHGQYDEKESPKHCRDKRLLSFQNKSVKESKSRDAKRSSDAGQSVSSVDSHEVSGRYLYGITDLVRLSSKKASAVSDTDS